MSHLRLLIDRETWADLVRRAEATNVTVSALVRRYAVEGLLRDESRDDIRRALMEASGGPK